MYDMRFKVLECLNTCAETARNDTSLMSQGFESMSFTCASEFFQGSGYCGHITIQIAICGPRNGGCGCVHVWRRQCVALAGVLAVIAIVPPILFHLKIDHDRNFWFASFINPIVGDHDVYSFARLVQANHLFALSRCESAATIEL